MSWNARIRAALHGEVDAADVSARLVASHVLDDLRQRLADRRLDAELAHSGEEWRVTDDLALVAAPLWFADALVSLARSLYDAEMAAHPDRPSVMSAWSHSEALVLLGPVEPIIAELSAVFADRSRRSTLPVPLTITPVAMRSGSLLPLPSGYLRGLLDGADRLEGAVQAALQDLSTLTARSPVPPWLDAGLQRLRGDLAGLQSRLEMARTRGATLIRQPALDEPAARALANDLWQIIETYLQIGQVLVAPRLLPGAPPAFAPPPKPSFPPPPVPPTPPRAIPPAQNRIAPSPPSAAAQPLPLSPMVVPPPFLSPPEEEPARTLPAIAPSWKREDAASEQASPPPPLAGPPDRHLPQIGPATGGPAARSDRSGTDARQLPEVAPTVPARVADGAQDPARGMPRIDVSGGKAAGGTPPHPVPPAGAAPSRSTGEKGAPDGRPSPARELPRIAPPAKNDTPHAIPVVAPSPVRNDEAVRAIPVVEPVLHAEPLAAGGRRIERGERWLLSSSATRHRLRAQGTEDEAERALVAFWDARGWRLSAQEQAYLTEAAGLLSSGAIVPAGRSLDKAPFAPIYQVRAGTITILGQQLPAGTYLAFDYSHERLLRPGSHDGLPD